MHGLSALSSCKEMRNSWLMTVVVKDHSYISTTVVSPSLIVDCIRGRLGLKTSLFNVKTKLDQNFDFTDGDRDSEENVFGRRLKS